MRDVLRSQLVRILLVLCACVLLATAVFAQSSIDGAIAGTVSDQSKAVVPNAKVTIRNIGTNATSTAVSDEAGKFRVMHLQPGTYEVKVDAANFGSKTDKVVVEVGRVTSLELSLAVAGAKESVDITAEAPVINTTQQDFSNNINEAQIQTLPSNGRRWSSYALLTPGATPDGTFGLISFRGISGLLNNNTVDGGDNNQAFFSEERGRTRAAYTVSQSSIREFQVNTSNYSAEYGRAAGAVVNSVTKSGTNSLHGEGFWFIRDNALGATNPFTQHYVQDSTGAWTPEKFKPEDRRQQFGGNLGGAIVKDKLFFFFNYDGQRRNFPGNAVFSNPSFLAPMTTNGSSSEFGTLVSRFGIGKTGTNACTPWPACATNTATPGYAAYLQQAQGLFNQGMNFLVGETGNVPRTGDQNIFFPKLDWVVNQKNTVTFSYNRMRWNSPAGVQTQATNTYGTASFGNDGVKTDMFNARLTMIVNNTTTNEVRYQWGRDFEFQSSQPLNANEAAMNFPLTADGRLPYISITGGLGFGRPNFLERSSYPDETRNQIADSLTKSYGRHLIKAGVDVNRNNDAYSNLYQGGGQYNYKNRLDFITDFDAFANGTTLSALNYSNYYQAFGPQGVEFHTYDYAGFLQDDIRLFPRLTLSLGARYEYEKLPKVQFGNAAIGAVMNPLLAAKNLPQLYNPSSQFPDDMNNIGPRIGFAWDVFGNGKTSVRGGYGLYYGRINNGAIGNALLNTGLNPGVSTQSSYSWCPTQKTSGGKITCYQGPTSPFTTFASLGSITGVPPVPSVVFFNSNMQTPQIHQADLIIEREIAKNTVVSASYLLSLGRELPQFVDANIAPSTRNVTYQLNGVPAGSSLTNGATMTVPYYDARLTSQFAAVMDVTSSINSNYNALVLQVNRRMTNNLQFQASYTWSHAIDDGQNSQTQTASYTAAFDPYNLQLERGTSNFDIRHRIVGNMVWQPTYFQSHGKLAHTIIDGWSIAPVVTFSTGRPFTESVSGNAYETFNSGSYTYGAAGGLNGGGGVYRLGGLLGRNSFRYPNLLNIDMRLSRKFRITERQNVEFLAEAFNLFNSEQITTLNSGLYQTAAPAVAGGPMQLNFVNNIAGQSPFGSYSGASGLYRERQVQLGVRYSF